MTRPDPLLVFDVNETLLDIAPLTPLFESWFGDRHSMRKWFAETILHSQSLSLAGSYVDFGELAESVLHMSADAANVSLPGNAVARLKNKMLELHA